jgi:hypothetical protein
MVLLQRNYDIMEYLRPGLSVWCFQCRLMLRSKRNKIELYNCAHSPSQTRCRFVLGEEEGGSTMTASSSSSLLSSSSNKSITCFWVVIVVVVVGAVPLLFPLVTPDLGAADDDDNDKDARVFDVGRDGRTTTTSSVELSVVVLCCACDDGILVETCKCNVVLLRYRPSPNFSNVRPPDFSSRPK